ncbi:hypothetical protein D3C81_1511400 [compost metagenome]
MGQRVHAGGGGDLRRQAEGQLGIEDDDSRQHPGMEDDALDMRLVVGDDRRAAHFRTGTGGGGHRDHRRHAGDIDAAGVVADVFEVPERAVLPHHQGNRLAGIQGRTSTEGDHAVVATGLEGGYAVRDIGPGGVALDPMEQPGVQPSVAALAQGGVDHG